MVDGVTIRGPIEPGFERILSPEAIAFVAELERKFGPERNRLLGLRAQRQRELDSGKKPDFLPE
ncbi:MAG TPA: malate synthase A, partial [Stellaceae bacterium]|nr:malate synthase A [Stellaceae bacterium]